MDVRGLKLTALRRNIGVVFQEALLFNRSISDNLRVGKPDATDEEMRIAASRAALSSDIFVAAAGGSAATGAATGAAAGASAAAPPSAAALARSACSAPR